jgi:hypothetical protein
LCRGTPPQGAGSDGACHCRCRACAQAKNISITVKTITVGMAYLATFIFGANSAGLTGEHARPPGAAVPLQRVWSAA